MSRRLVLAAVLFGLLGPGPIAGALAAGVDPRFPEVTTLGLNGKPVRLVLTGTAPRTKYGFRVYTVASYVQEGVRAGSPERLAALDAPKLLHLIFERDVDGSTMAQAFRASIGASHPAPAFAAELAALERYFVANPAHQGDHVRLAHVPGSGLAVQVNGGPYRLVGGVPFAQAAWGTYFGPNHLGVALKSGLSSRLR